MSFAGLCVWIELIGGGKIEGIVTDAREGAIVIGHQTIPAHLVADLKVVAVKPTETNTAFQQTPLFKPPQINLALPSSSHSLHTQIPSVADSDVDSKIDFATLPLHKNKQRNRSKPTGKSQNRNNMNNNSSNIISLDKMAISEDFDFQAQLLKFDKNRVFAEIRASEEAGSFESGGGAAGFCGRDRLGVREMVLDVAESETTGHEPDSESNADDDFRPHMFKSQTGTRIPAITASEMTQIERIAAFETGPNETQMIENAGRSAAILVLQVLTNSRHDSTPTVIILTGNNRIGAFGLCLARHLANHEVSVFVWAPGREVHLIDTVAQQLKIFTPTGGTVVQSISELKACHAMTVDIVVDAIVGSETPIFWDKDASEMITWATKSSAHILSLEIPSGIDPSNSGNPQPLYISANWTLSFGLPNLCLFNLSHSVAGDLFLADIGLPKYAFQKMRITYHCPFAEKFIVKISK
ncbi:enhancer of mRNA decapping [Physocladia obscura]|uniref:Enhancer of mRNA-decapping protein 3 n=1 Tax=Physocladia obscura TaxID=109957 RepID=A0AAD5T568_9FUNG|nr:enhancer of mRNA decapping [Physocladia obscura]